jgi:hypothetical protein
MRHNRSNLGSTLMKTAIASVLALGALALIVPAGAQNLSTSGLRLYDNFNSRFIDPAKWIAQWQCGGTIMECVREIQDEHLRLRVRGYGASDSNEGTQFGSSGLSLAASSATDIAADLVVRRSATQACSTNPGFSGHAQALISGSFFNGGGGTPDDDVQAYFQLDRYAFYQAGTVQAGGFLKYQGQFFDNVDLGLVNIGERVRIELRWDRPNHQFVVRVFHPDSGAVSEQNMPYAISDTTPAVSQFKNISANVFPANCFGSRVSSELEILISDVLTN